MEQWNCNYVTMEQWKMEEKNLTRQQCNCKNVAM